MAAGLGNFQPIFLTLTQRDCELLRECGERFGVRGLAASYDVANPIYSRPAVWAGLHGTKLQAEPAPPKEYAT